MYFTPTYAPASMKVDKGTVQLAFKNGASYSVVVGRRASGTAFTEIVSAIVSEQASDRDVGEDERRALKVVKVGNNQARLLGSAALGTVLDWHQDGLQIGLSGPHGAERVVVGVAEALRLTPREASSTTLGELPDDYEVIGRSVNDAFERDSYTVSLMPAKPGGLEFGTISVTVVPRGMAPASFTAARDKLKLMRVRGTDAALGETTSELPAAGGPRTFVQRALAWLEHEDLLVQIQASVPEAELVKLAEGLKETTEQEWRRQMKA